MKKNGNIFWYLIEAAEYSIVASRMLFQTSLMGRGGIRRGCKCIKTGAKTCFMWILLVEQQQEHVLCGPTEGDAKRYNNKKTNVSKHSVLYYSCDRDVGPDPKGHTHYSQPAREEDR